MRAMERDLLDPSHKGSGWHGWKLPPSVRMFKLELAPWNDLLMTVGLKKRLPHTIKWQDLADVSMRRYMQYQIKRLEALKHTPNLYWKRAESLLKTSVSFRVSAYNKIFPKWWHEKSLGEVWLELRKIERLLRKNSSDLIYRRVYIDKDKSKGTKRPLGVPSNEWRVIMHMWNNFLTQFLRDELEDWNHGYQPGRGTLTAWKDWLLKVRKAKNIYEFDFKQFFPSVRATDVSEYLEYRGVPENVCIWLNKINRVLPILPKVKELDETYTEKMSFMYKRMKSMNTIKSRVASQWMTDMPPMVSYDFLRGLETDWLSSEVKGLPQGLNTSPILSISTLVWWKQELEAQGIHLNMYADDGMAYSDHEFVFPSKVGNIEVHPEKSRWIKRDGVWLVPVVKYLGLEYLPKDNIIRGATRKGSTLEFDSDRLELLPLLKRLNGTKPYEKDKMDLLASSGVFGLVQAKLYQGDWEELSWLSKGWSRHPLSWYQGQLDAKGHPTMSSHACQYLSRIAYATMKGKMHLSYPVKVPRDSYYKQSCCNQKSPDL